MKIKRSHHSRRPAINRIVAGTFEGTDALVARVVKDSAANMPSWRAARAGVAMAIADAASKDHVWMTTAEFAAWFSRFVAPPRPGARLRVSMEEVVGIATHRRRAIMDGARIRKWEALAMAHYAIHGDVLPIAPGDPAAFNAWVTGNFGFVEAIARAVEVEARYISSRMAGYRMVDGQRFARTPEQPIIRALDWVLRVGPYSPYGHRLPAQAFPGQTTEEFASCGF